MFCDRCFNISTGPECPICLDPARDDARLCVVEEPLDVLALERSGAFRGRYHVLHGAISPMDGIGPDRLRIRQLLQRVVEREHDGDPFAEVVLATNPTLEGEATAMYLAERLVGSRRLRHAHRPGHPRRGRPGVRRRGDPGPRAPGSARVRSGTRAMSYLINEALLRLIKPAHRARPGR